MNNQSYQSLNFCYNYAYNCNDIKQMFRAVKTIGKWFGINGLNAFQQGWQDKFNKQIKNFRKGATYEK